jgi:hypothetical protein
MKTWQHFAPVHGWKAFDDSRTLTAALWDSLPAASWNYINLAAGSSVWESHRDGSMVRVHYSGERVVEFVVQTGVASDTIHPIVTRFHFSHVTPAT